MLSCNATTLSLAYALAMWFFTTGLIPELTLLGHMWIVIEHFFDAWHIHGTIFRYQSGNDK